MYHLCVIWDSLLCLFQGQQEKKSLCVYIPMKVVMVLALMVCEAAFYAEQNRGESLCRAQLLSRVAAGRWTGGGADGISVDSRLGERVPDAGDPLPAHPAFLPSLHFSLGSLIATLQEDASPERHGAPGFPPSPADPARQDHEAGFSGHGSRCCCSVSPWCRRPGRF